MKHYTKFLSYFQHVCSFSGVKVTFGKNTLAKNSGQIYDMLNFNKKVKEHPEGVSYTRCCSCLPLILKAIVALFVGVGQREAPFCSNSLNF